MLTLNGTESKHIALIGKARSGKDTVARRLMQRHAYTRVAFADPLKGMALNIDPNISTASQPVRLSTLVEATGWELAKDFYPETRRFLQNLGESVRAFDPNFWVNVAMDKIDVADTWNLPVVVTDVRYINEALALRNRGFTMVRVVRPEIESTDTHASETELDNWAVRHTIHNVNALSELHAQVDALTD